MTLQSLLQQHDSVITQGEKDSSLVLKWSGVCRAATIC